MSLRVLDLARSIFKLNFEKNLSRVEPIILIKYLPVKQRVCNMRYPKLVKEIRKTII